MTGLLPASTALQGGVEGGFMKIAIFLTLARSTAVRQNPRPLERGASLFTRSSILSGRKKTDLNDNINQGAVSFSENLPLIKRNG